MDFLLLAFLLTQAPPAKSPAAAQEAPSARPPLLDTSRLKDPVEITSQKVQGGRNQATFSGNVVVKSRTLNLRCDRMIAWYAGPGEVTRVECMGNVLAVDGDKTARGEHADFDVPSSVLVVTGSPEARQGNSYMAGSRVRFVVGEENLEVKDARVIFETAPLKQRRLQPAKGGAKP